MHNNYDVIISDYRKEVARLKESNRRKREKIKRLNETWAVRLAKMVAERDDYKGRWMRCFNV